MNAFVRISDYLSIMTAIRRLEEISEDVKQARADLLRLGNGIGEEWQGRARQAFNEAVERVAKDIQTTMGLMQSLQDDMRKTAEEIRRLSQK